MFIPISFIAIVLIVIAYYAGVKDKQKERSNGYWEGRLSGWKACENMILNRAEEAGFKNKDGKTMTEEELWEELIQ